ncbi:MAG: hypothetical protein ACKO3F_08680 [Cyanobium sp.]
MADTQADSAAHLILEVAMETKMPRAQKSGLTSASVVGQTSSFLTTACS